MARQALSHPVLPLTFDAGVDLTAHRNKLVMMSADQQIDPCVAGGEGFLGVLYDLDSDKVNGAEVGAAGDECNVVVLGVAAVLSGAAFNPGVMLTSDAEARAVTAVATNTIVGMALEPATAADQLVSMLILHVGIL